ncbi:MAG TPA: hypothetical protein VJR89_10330 [Polyangiales bacterium]|nr:hypothetical protein [Polyangiales bacterium]
MLAQLSAEFFARSPMLAFPVFALGVCLSVFLAVSIRALFGRSDRMQRMAEIPLEDSEVKHHG